MPRVGDSLSRSLSRVAVFSSEGLAAALRHAIAAEEAYWAPNGTGISQYHAAYNRSRAVLARAAANAAPRMRQWEPQDEAARMARYLAQPSGGPLQAGEAPPNPEDAARYAAAAMEAGGLTPYEAAVVGVVMALAEAGARACHENPDDRGTIRWWTARYIEGLLTADEATRYREHVGDGNSPLGRVAWFVLRVMGETIWEGQPSYAAGLAWLAARVVFSEA